MKRYRDTEALRSGFAEKSVAIRQRLADFSEVLPDLYFYELVYCLLTPQSSAVNAGQVTEALMRARLLEETVDPVPVLRNGGAYIRFHNTKARNILHAKEQLSDILAALANGDGAPRQRDWLVANVRGLGMKEASHFLRNIGRRDLAILDRHILRNLAKHRVIRSIPKTLTKKQYLAIERRFLDFARDLGLTMDELDLYFWSRETGEILK